MSTASIITWVRKPSRTSWPSASATASSSRCGTGAIVNHVQITAAESIGVEGRGAYYQEAGALVDMIQNHLLQVMATIAMEPSASFRANCVRDERSKLLRSIRPMTHDEILQNAVAGQYGPARIGGQDLPGFRQEKGVDPEVANRHLRRRYLLRG